jgi:hypothetical protein
LNRALQLGEAHQTMIAGGKQLDLSPVYVNLGEAYLAQASGLTADNPDSEVGRQKTEDYDKAVKYFDLASRSLSGFASSDARLFSWLADVYEGQAQMDAQELSAAPPDRRNSLVSERDELRHKSEESLRRAQEILVAGNVSSSDSAYRGLMLEQGNIIFRREVGASAEEKAGYYRQALARYQQAAALFPDDPRPLLYQGLCYERLTGIAQSGEEKQKDFALGEAALHKALTLQITSPDYSPALPYRVLASLYAHMNDFHSALEALQKAQQVDPAAAQSEQLNREIQSVQQFLAAQEKGK